MSTHAASCAVIQGTSFVLGKALCQTLGQKGCFN